MNSKKIIDRVIKTYLHLDLSILQQIVEVCIHRRSSINLRYLKDLLKTSDNHKADTQRDYLNLSCEINKIKLTNRDKKYANYKGKNQMHLNKFEA